MLCYSLKNKQNIVLQIVFNINIILQSYDGSENQLFLLIVKWAKNKRTTGFICTHINTYIHIYKHIHILIHKNTYLCIYLYVAIPGYLFSYFTQTAFLNIDAKKHI